MIKVVIAVLLWSLWVQAETTKYSEGYAPRTVVNHGQIHLTGTVVSAYFLILLWVLAVIAVPLLIQTS